VSETDQPTAEPTEVETPATTTEAAASAPVSESAEAPATSRGERKLRTGVVVSEKMDKTVLVRIQQVVRHPAYGKTIRRTSKLAAHDEANDAHVGDTVRLMETRPLSKTKRWRVIEILERAK
jgi:small subunit ribosomal protein S17